MKKRIKPVVAAMTIGVIALNVMQVSAQSLTKYGHTMNYSCTLVNNRKATASTSCSGANSVYVKINVNYNEGGTGAKLVSKDNSNRVATTATVSLTGDRYIASLDSHHKAIVSYKGVYQTITKSMY